MVGRHKDKEVGSRGLYQGMVIRRDGQKFEILRQDNGYPDWDSTKQT
jgi:hypothetical protein